MSAGTNKPALRLPAFPKGYAARWLWVQAALRRICAAAGISLRIDGADSATVGADGSMQFKVGSGGGGSSALPWQINSAGHINPANVGTVMPTLGGEPLDTTAHVLDLSAAGDYVYFKLTFTVYWVESFLASWTLGTVSVEQGSSIPSETTTVKYLTFNTIAGGAAAGPSYYNQSIAIRLVDAGIYATALEYNPP